MGWYFRKSASLGLVRLNFSRGGVGVSFGVRGARIGIGPRGKYIHVGRHGLYFRQSLNSSTPSLPLLPAGTAAAETIIDSADVSEMRDEASAALLDELTRVRTRIPRLPGTVIGTAVLAIVFLVGGSLTWSAVTVILGIALSFWAGAVDQRDGALDLEYELTGPAATAYETLCKAATSLVQAGRVRLVEATADTSDWKRNAGASDLIRIKQVWPRFGMPKGVRSSIQAPVLPCGTQELYLLPDHLVVSAASSVGAVAYADLKVEIRETRFIEENGVPADAQVVDHTWRFVNRSGGPDRRYSNNVQLPVAKYAEISLSSRSGLNERLQISNVAASHVFVDALAKMTKVHEVLTPELPQGVVVEESKITKPSPCFSEAFDVVPLPSLDLLSMPTRPEDLISAEELTTEANLLVAKLMDLGVDGRVTEIHIGPVVTTFEFEPAAGVRASQIVSCRADLALAFRVHHIRILAVPGRGTVGVEIPNRQRRTVYLREVLSSPQYDSIDAVLKIPLGVDVMGVPVVADLAKMQHLLVVGAPGSGKSVCLNAIITGLLFQHGPGTLRMAMVDPRMLELSPYNGIPHLVMPVVTKSKPARRALRWAVSEMEKRNELLAEYGAQNIAAYNEMVASGKVTALGAARPAYSLSHVVVIIDEFADLMLTAPAEIEEPIARLAMTAHTVGIHLVLATSPGAITDVIKHNFLSRIVFQLASETDSRTALDVDGAEALLGSGDMIFTSSGSPELHRIQGAYVSEKDSDQVAEFWKSKVSHGLPESSVGEF